MTTKISTSEISANSITAALLSATAIVDKLGYIPADANNVTSASQYANTGIANAASASLYANTGINNAASASLYANTGIANATSASLYANTGINNAASASLYANTGINNAASASLYANSGITLAQASYNQGNSTAIVSNTALNNAASASLYANTGINNAASASLYANTGINNAASASVYANTGITLAQAAYNQGNSTATVANTAVNNAASASLYANAANTLANTKAAVYNTSSAPANANVDDIWIDPNSGIEYVYIRSNNASQWIEFGAVGTPLNATANLQFVDQSILATDNTRDIQILNPGTGNIVMTAASTIISGNLIANAGGATATFNNIGAAYFRVNVATIQANSAAINIVGSNGYYTQRPTSNGYMMQITGLDNTPTRVVVDSASTDGSAYSAFIGRKARGTHQNPSAAQNGDLLSRFTGNGYGATGYGVNAGGGSVDVYAIENYTDTARGANVSISVTPPGSNVRQIMASFSSNNITLKGNVIANSSSSLTSYFYNIKVDGNIYYSTQTPAANSSQYINYTTGQQQLLNITGTTTLVHQNIVPGRNIYVIAHNNTVADQTINLSIPSLNCTAMRDKNGKYNQAPSNTFTIFAGTTAVIQFFSFYTDTANIYCSLTPT